jgi:uncharacterized membrane-anchored protein
MMSSLNKEQQDFINHLSHKMKTQDTRCTAQPYALVIRTEEMVYGIDTDYTDNVCLMWNDEVYHSFDDLLEYLKESEYEAELAKIKESSVDDLSGFATYVGGAYMTGFNTVKTADSSKGCMQGNLFLTEDAANDYIKANKHNLNNPDTYGIHLYRNPEMEKLYEIIHALADEGVADE